MQTLFSPLFQYLIVNVKFSLILDSIIKSIDCSFTVICNCTNLFLLSLERDYLFIP